MNTRMMLGTDLEEEVAEALHNSCVPDHATYPYSGRQIAERRAFIKQAQVAIKVITRRGGYVK